MLETVRVKSSKHPNGFYVVNKEDFDDETMELFESKPKKKAAEKTEPERVSRKKAAKKDKK